MLSQKMGLVEVSVCDVGITLYQNWDNIIEKLYKIATFCFSHQPMLVRCQQLSVFR